MNAITSVINNKYVRAGSMLFGAYAAYKLSGKWKLTGFTDLSVSQHVVAPILAVNGILELSEQRR